MVENSQIPRCGCTYSGEQIKQSLEDGLKVDNVPGPNQWPNQCNDCFNSDIEKGRLYSSSFLEVQACVFFRGFVFFFFCLFVCFLKTF